jgi:hypothetical protein
MPHNRTSASPDRSDTFSNYRDWRAFLAAMQAPVTCASVVTALKAGHDWLTGHARVADSGSETCKWLLGETELVSRKTLGV